MSFIFDKRLSPEQAINFKASSKAAFGFMSKLDLTGAVPFAPMIFAADPSVAAAPPAGGDQVTEVGSATATAVALLTRVSWALGATDPICIEGLVPINLKQTIVGML